MRDTISKRAALVGRKVRTHGEIRKIVGVYRGIKGGIILDKPVEGFHSWNIEDVIL